MLNRSGSTNRVADGSTFTARMLATGVPEAAVGRAADVSRFPIGGPDLDQRPRSVLAEVADFGDLASQGALDESPTALWAQIKP